MSDGPTIAAISLAGCFGCRMSLTEIPEEGILRLIGQAEADRTAGRFLLGLVEGGCGSEDDVRVLREFRSRSRILVAVGDCAITGGVPAMRNGIPLKECLETVYVSAPGVQNPGKAVPNDAELPPLLDRVYHCAEVVQIDHSVPGCPPSVEALQAALAAILTGRPVELPYELIRYD